MALQNIGAANSDDAFYRYKMPKMITKIEGRGNGIKTNIVNMVDIAKALARPASYTTKFFGCELGAQSKFDEKSGVSLVNGAHDTSKLAGLLEIFIKKYVQCYGCHNPETEVIITKTQMIILKCAACGFLSDVDMRDKLTTFILKNPPEQKKGSKDKKAMRRAEKERLKEGEAADEELKKLKKVTKKGTAATSKPVTAKKKVSGSDEEHSSPAGSQADDNGDAEDDDESVEWQTDTSAEAARKRIQEQLSAATAEMVMLTTVSEPSKEETKPQRKEKTSSNNGTSKVPEKPTTFEVIDKEIKGYLNKKSPASEVVSFLDSLIVSPEEKMNSLVGALFEGVGKGLKKEVEKKKTYLAAAVKDEVSQLLFLCTLESFCEKSGRDAVKEVPLVVKVLYDGDVLEEEPIVKWYEGGLAGNNKSSQIWKSMKPLIEWLQSADTDSGEE